MGPLGHWGFLFTKHKCFSLQSTKQSEYHSQPGSHLKASAGILQSNAICTSVVHTSAAPWIKEQEIVCSCNIRFPVANPGNTAPQLKFSFKTLYCPSVRVLVYTLPFKIQPPDFKVIISHSSWSPMVHDVQLTHDMHTLTGCEPPDLQPPVKSGVEQ